MDYIIGIDIGTTSTKAIAFDLNGKILCKKSIEYPILNPKPSYSEQDPEEIFTAVLNSIKSVIIENVYKKPIGVSFSAAMHSVIAVDKDGIPLTNCIIWADTRSNEYAEKIKNSKVGHEIYMRTGTPIHPMSPLSKLAWMQDNMKDIVNKTYKFISMKEYVFFKLFGKYVIDYSIASATGMFDIYDLKWNKDALAILNINEDKLSTPVSPTYVMKGILNGYASFMEIDSDTPFVLGGSDGCLANLGANAIKQGDAAITIGTSGAVRVISNKPKNDEKERIFSYILTENHYVLGGPVNNGGVIFRWFRDNFSPMEIQEAKDLNIDPYVLLTDKAMSVPAGSDGLIFLPYLLGERAPHWDANMRGVYFGINIKHTRDHFIRALLEGIIFGIYSVGRALEETTGKINTIYATGGFARSKMWVQMLADIFNKKVVIAESYESSGLGAAVIGMKALGVIDNIEEVENLVPISKEFYPDEKNHDIYMKNYKIFDRLYEKLKDEFKEITKIQ
ncbi:gluconokinase [Clostridium algifaecis]|uniref:Gluconokinase n=1 Tax=Clostridium algifaecis TaxID=1472040 RepID=A0ABS4KQE0_9CLOT|nr:gluconokinase [Clostridium algifaecis]